jgi:osmoprotectant transport system substrate-binding protein
MRGRAFFLLIGLALATTACTVQIGGGPPSEFVSRSDVKDETIVVASFDFEESVILAELYATILGEHGYPVARFMSLGSREIVQPALQQGHVDLVPEYAGSAFEFLTFNGAQGAMGSDLRTRLESLLAPRGVEVLRFSQAQDKNAVVVTPTVAQEHQLRSISDLADVAPRFTLGGPPECPERPLCLIGLERVYSLEFDDFLPLAPGSATLAALTGNEIDAGVMFSTDPNILTYDLTLLRDDRHLQPKENVVPVLRREVIDQHGAEVVDLIDSVSRKLTTVVLRSLNRQVALGEAPYDVAAGWLRTEGLIR